MQLDLHAINNIEKGKYKETYTRKKTSLHDLRKVVALPVRVTLFDFLYLKELIMKIIGKYLSITGVLLSIIFPPFENGTYSGYGFIFQQYQTFFGTMNVYDFINMQQLFLQIVAILFMGLSISFFSKNKTEKADDVYRKCPACAEEVKVEAKLCRYCHTDLPEISESEYNEMLEIIHKS
jgi:hypothetical protein